MTDSLYVFQLPNKEYIELVDDVARMVIIQFAIQFLFYINNASEVQFFSADFMLLVIYMTLGVLLYRLVFKKLVKFE